MKIKGHAVLFIIYIALSAVLLYFCRDEKGLSYQQIFIVFFLLLTGSYIYYERYKIEKLNYQIDDERKSLQQVLDLSLDGIFVENERGEILDCNRSAHEMFGCTKEEMLTLSIRDLVSEEFAKDLPEIIPDSMVTKNRYVERINKRKDGTLFPTEVYTRYIKIGDRKRLIAFIRDISGRKELENRLKQFSIKDDLTGIYNRRYMIDQLVLMVEKLKRDKAGFFSIVLLDLDNFKEINDIYGHISGDSVLSRFAEKLSSGLRKIDIAGRYGGDEFLVLMPGTSSENSCKVLNRLRANVKSMTLDNNVKISFSAGIVELNQQSVIGKDIKEILNWADIPMYQAKKKGKDRLVCI